MFILVNQAGIIEAKTETLYNPTSLQRGWQEFNGTIGELYESHGVPRYKLVDGIPVERTQAEISADIAAIPISTPTVQEQTDALLLDHEERLIYLELEANQ